MEKSSPLNINIDMSNSNSNNNSNNNNNNNNGPLKQKIILLGNINVGKTSIILRAIENKFTKTKSTICHDLRIKKFTIEDKEVIQYLWDPAGQERFRVVTNAFCKNVDGVIFIYDITDAISFSQIPNWIELFDRITNTPDCRKFLIGNKLDLESQRAIAYDIAKNMAISLDMEYYETSALYDNEDINNMFKDLAEKIYQNPSTNNNTEASFESKILLSRDKLRNDDMVMSDGISKGCCIGGSG